MRKLVNLYVELDNFGVNLICPLSLEVYAYLDGIIDGWTTKLTSLMAGASDQQQLAVSRSVLDLMLEILINYLISLLHRWN